MTYRERKIRKVVLPISEGIMISKPQEVLLQHGKTTVDIGQFCYRRRSRAKRVRNKGVLVDIESLDVARVKQVRKLIKDVSDAVKVGGLRPFTFYGTYQTFIRFLTWCDDSGHGDVLRNESSARAAFRSFAALQKRLADQHVLKATPALKALLDVAMVLNSYFSIDSITAGVNMLSANLAQTEHTKPADDESLGQTLSWGITFLEGFAEFLIEQRPYPYALRVPAYVGFPDNRLWILPVQVWACPPDSEKSFNVAWDYYVGRIRSYEELASIVAEHRDRIRTINDANASLVAANKDPYHPRRTERGFLAMAAFYHLMLAAGGQNATPVVELPWSEELERSVMDANSIGAGFKSIKWRAQGKTIEFEMRWQFLPYLRTYLRLRKHLLNGRKCNYLFFTYGENHGQFDEPKQASTAVLRVTFRDACERVAGFKPVAPRQLRATKGDFVIRDGDVTLAAKVLNNDRKTVAAAYSEGSVVTQAVEMSEHYDRMRRMMKNGRNGEEERAMGGCKEPRKPISIIAAPPVKPNCEDEEGCLFCKHYRLHADEKDARKLFSARRCVRVVASQPHLGNQYETVMAPVLKQLEFYIGLIGEREPELVARVEQEVDEEDMLDQFWLAKLEALIAIGMELL